jgi:hypothetical protein
MKQKYRFQFIGIEIKKQFYQVCHNRGFKCELNFCTGRLCLKVIKLSVSPIKAKKISYLIKKIIYFKDGTIKICLHYILFFSTTYPFGKVFLVPY